MICYRDRTYCITPDCMLPHALTPEIEAAAEMAGLPLSVASLCGDDVFARLRMVVVEHRPEIEFTQGQVNRLLDEYEESL